MSAPAVERRTVEVAETLQNEPNFVAAEVLGKAAHSELMVASETHRPNLENPDEVEALLVDFVESQNLQSATTGEYESDGIRVHATRVTSNEELFDVEFGYDNELDATGVLVDVDRIEKGSPYVNTGGLILRVSATRKQPDGSVAVDRITDPDMQHYAFARLADTLTTVTNKKITPRVVGDGNPLHDRSYRLRKALKTDHTIIDLD